MGRHAYCIIAHHEPSILRVLIELIDDVRNDIYLLLDKKADERLFEDIRPRNAGFARVERRDIRWGAGSQVDAELDLLKATGGGYDYVHLVSGVDLPLHSQDWIHVYCDEHNGEEFFESSSKIPLGALPCVDYHHFFLEQMRINNIMLRKTCSLLRRSVIAIERLFGFRRSYPMPLYKGGNWFSITGKLCRWMLEKEDLICRNFRHIHTADEIVPITLLSNSPYAEHKAGCKRLIDWNRGGPYIWRIEDFGMLSQSDAFFARKFSSEHMDIVDAVRNMVLGESGSLKGQV